MFVKYRYTFYLFICQKHIWSHACGTKQEHLQFQFIYIAVYINLFFVVLVTVWSKFMCIFNLFNFFKLTFFFCKILTKNNNTNLTQTLTNIPNQRCRTFVQHSNYKKHTIHDTHRNSNTYNIRCGCVILFRNAVVVHIWNVNKFTRDFKNVFSDQTVCTFRWRSGSSPKRQARVHV